jgi:hypothetical protein
MSHTFEISRPDGAPPLPAAWSIEGNDARSAPSLT